jgi:hypothetical protein
VFTILIEYANTREGKPGYHLACHMVDGSVHRGAVIRWGDDFVLLETTDAAGETKVQFTVNKRYCVWCEIEW